jgi:hypothetical protein
VLIERDYDCSATPFPPTLALRVVHQNAAHHLGCDSKEMGSVFPIHSLANQPQIRFMDETAGLQGIRMALTPQMAAGQAAQFVVKQWH